MSEIIKRLMTSKDVHERCTDWVDAQKDISFTNDKTSRQRDSDSDDFVDTDSEFDSVSECGTKRRRVAKKLKAEVLSLKCEWINCDFNNTSMETFIKHVSNHISDLEIKKTEEDIEVYVCKWNGCAFQSGVTVEIMRHVNYHAYHSKLKCIGMNIRGRVKLPKCRRDPDWKNILETMPPHVCQWNDCVGKEYTNYQLFLFHVLTHVECNPRGNKVEGGVQCNWKGCNGKYPSLYKLRDHIRCHTKEKIVACPDCGNMFASNTKFHDHCKRQIPLEVQGFQCSHCNKFYPTECILRDHMRNHIYHYKCHLCDMTCETPASLKKHILYRHDTVRAFPCKMCPHAAKSQQDLDSHMSIHSNGANYHCNVEGCSYSCKNAYSMDRHVERVHRLEVRWYCCHECPIKYRKSYRLTKHLIESHHLRCLSGHRRFQYILEDDGCYRLQTIRYESIDESAQAAKDIINSPQNSQGEYSPRLSVPNLEIVEDQEDTNESGSKTRSQIPPHIVMIDNYTGKSMPTILISIDEIDECGNILSSKLVETHETHELPPSTEPPIILT